MIPLPGSAAICAGTLSDVAAVSTDQRGYPRTNSSYTNSTSTACVDAGAVQTNYLLTFTTEPPASIETETAFSSADAPVVTLYETTTKTAFIAGMGTLAVASSPSASTSLSANAISLTAGVGSFSGIAVSSSINNAEATLAATLQLNPTVTPAPSITAASTYIEVIPLLALPAATLADGTVGVSYLATITATGGAGTMTYSIISGSLPGGLSFSTSGAIAGTPTAAGRFTFSVKATDGDGNIAAQSYSLTVIAPTASVILTAGTNPIFLKNAVKFTVVVTSTAKTPTGTVTFYAGSTALCSASPLNSSTGQATCTTSALVVGANDITAQYNGDSNFQQESSEPLTEEVMNFSIGTEASTLTVASGKTASYRLTIAPVGSNATFPAPITLSLSGLPPSCTFSFTSESSEFNATTGTIAAGAGTIEVTLNVRTAGSESTQTAARQVSSRLAPLALALLLLPFAGRQRRSGRRLNRMASLVLLLAAGAVIMVGVSGCSSLVVSDLQNIHTYQNVSISGSAGALTNTSTVTLTVE
jgi:hypothetical protein